MEKLTEAERTAAIEGVIDLAYSFANKICPHGDRDLVNDCAQEAMVGFCRAAKYYDPSRGAKFVTYCHLAGLREVWNFMAKHRARGISKSFTRGFDTDDLPLTMNFELLAGNDILDRDREHADDDPLPENFWESALAKLDARSRRVMVRRFRDGAVLRTIAREEGISKERVRQLIDAALAKLRKDPFLANLADR